ncbi:FAD-dependent oxidoreductase, partial [Alphaproteobacteria bacterium]|nr:FAD-dependent oxidoreductase [Alphaproteobacteria bacterium]
MTLELQNIEKNIEGSQHIFPTSLVLEKNSINILLGATLSGKTTLMQLMGGIEKPTKGKIFFNGNDVTNTSVQKRNISMVYQQFINYPNFSVYENIASPLRLQKLEKSAIDHKVQEIAHLLKLTPMLSRKPNELSGGQQQRTALARALVKDSDLILLDEPFANLDFKLREELREELPKMFENKNTIVVYATTEPSEALLLGGNTVLLEEGKVIQFGKTQEIYRRPFVLDVLKNICKVDTNKSLRLVQGSHIVVKKLYEGDQAYILQLPDRRIIFLIPYQNKYTLIGTTDKEVSSYLNPQITNEEKKYLIDSANTFLKNSITSEDIVWTYAGIRPLLNDQNNNASKVTRDYEFDLNSSKAPIISIFGGKLTTYRKLAEHALQKLSEVMFVPNKTWTDKEKLPGSKKVQEKYFENFSQSLQ